MTFLEKMFKFENTYQDDKDHDFRVFRKNNFAVLEDIIYQKIQEIDDAECLMGYLKMYYEAVQTRTFREGSKQDTDELIEFFEEIEEANEGNDEIA